MSRREAAASYQLYAAYCFEAARVMADPGRRLALLNMAQAWTDLADHTQKSRNDEGPTGRHVSAGAAASNRAFTDSPKLHRRE